MSPSVTRTNWNRFEGGISLGRGVEAPSFFSPRPRHISYLYFIILEFGAMLFGLWYMAFPMAEHILEHHF